jgi:hypothetical protein
MAAERTLLCVEFDVDGVADEAAFDEDRSAFAHRRLGIVVKRVDRSDGVAADPDSIEHHGRPSAVRRAVAFVPHLPYFSAHTNRA